MRIYQALAGHFIAYLNCLEKGNSEWQEKHKEKIEEIVEKYLPHGSGIDNGNSFDFDNSREDKLIINSSYHRMDENGFYDGWIDYQVVIRPSLTANGINLDVKGRFGKHQDLKDYLGDIYYEALTAEIK
jgi:hypothetical protein